MRKLPPLPAIRAFEAAARLQSFKEAARELGVTPTAISHQIKSLEGILQTQLFIRQVRKVELTPAGAQLYPACGEALDLIAQAVGRIRPNASRRTVVLSATSSFMTQWLMPRLSEFAEAHPGINLQLHASETVVPLGTGIADIAVRYGPAPQGEMVHAFLFQDCFAPLCNPLLPIPDLEHAADVPRISSRWHKPDNRTPTWNRWFSAAGVNAPAGPPALSFDDDTHAAQAAIAGRGMALLSVKMMSKEIAEGLLVRPYEPSLEGHGHYALYTANASNKNDIEAVQRWLVQTTAPLRDI